MLGQTRLVQALLGLLAALAALVLTVLPLGVAHAYQPPAIRGHVNDAAGVLDPSQVRSLEAELTRVRRESGYHVVVLLIPTLADEPIEDVAYDTFNTWGVGDAGRDNGVLLVLAVAEQRIRIETGKGVGGELTDIESGRIIREQIKPLVVAGRWYDAAATGTAAITQALTGVASGRGPPPSTSDPLPELTLLHKIVIGVVLLIVIVLAIVFPGFRQVLFWIVFAFLRRGGGGGGGGGGGYSGGGGRSGGGGASG